MAPTTPTTTARVENIKALLAGEREYCVYEGCTAWADGLCGRHERLLGLA